MGGRASSPADAADPAAWPGSCRLRPPHARSVQRNGPGARVAAPSPVISSAAAGGGVGAVVARCRPANLHRHRSQASQHDPPVQDRHHGSPAGPGRSAAATGAQIHREATRPRRPRRRTRNLIRTGAAVAGVVVEGAAPGRAVRRVKAAVRAVDRDPPEASQSAEFAGIEWTSGALA